MLRHEDWAAVDDLRHGFLGATECRGAGDWDDVVARVGVALPVASVSQVHGDVVVAAVPDRRAPRAEADGIVSDLQGWLVGVVTADCAPALLVDRQRRVAAALHAGWRGAAAGVLEAGVRELAVRFGVEPRDLEVCLGPAIGPCCYQVGAEVRDAFARRTGQTTRDAWRQDGPRWRVDLRLAARRLLEAAGVPRVTAIGPCTACSADFCSYRRDGAGAGRQLSFIGWT